jgi:hypothetical protein
MKLSKLSRMVYPHKMPSPRGLLLRAAVLAAFFGFCHLAGWRAATTALSGTDPSAAGSTLTIGRGLLYVLAYLGFTVAVPILVLSAAGLRLIEAGVAREKIVAPCRRRLRPTRALVHGGNAVLITVLAFYFFYCPGLTTVRNLRDPHWAGPHIPAAAWDLHRSLTPRYEAWARQRLTAGTAKHVKFTDVPATEWPLFGSVFYLWATEALQAAWERDPSQAPQAPRAFARSAIEASVALVMDPDHHGWVKNHWGSDYMNRQNLFFRSLVIAAALSHEKLIGNGRRRRILSEQAVALAEELDASPHGFLDDYPFECYPVDILAAIAIMRDAYRHLGLDPEPWLARSQRAFQGDHLDETGLIPYMVDARSGRLEEPSRGIVNSWAGVFAGALYPDSAVHWQDLYEKSYWQEGFFAGYREYPHDMPQKNWLYDVDAGPILGGYSPAANAFGYAAARVNGRLDLARTLGEQLAVALWPLPDGRLLGPRILSITPHAPHLGEAAILYFLTRTPHSAAQMREGGRRAPAVWLGLLFYFGLGTVCVAGAAKRLRQWRQVGREEPDGTAQAVVWLSLLAAALLLLALNRHPFAMIAVLLALLLPRRVRVRPLRSSLGNGSHSD